MSIAKEQKTRVFEDVVRGLYSTGVKPTIDEILTQISLYFSSYPAGLPLPLPIDYIRSKEVSNVDKFNMLLAHLSMNLDVLYTVCLQQVDEAMLLSSSLVADLELLRTRRVRVETQIDDYLLSQFNTDGYFFSISDTFTDVSLTDLSNTSAYIDTVLGAVTLPILSSLSKRVDAQYIGTPQISITVNNEPGTFTTISPWSNAIDTLTNTVWEIQVQTDTPSEVIATLTIPLGNSTKTVDLTRIDYDPYGIVEVQTFMEVGVSEGGVLTYKEFGSKIETSQSRMVFADQLQEAATLRITLRKDKFDYYDSSSGAVKYRYIFGCKDLAIQEQVYDNAATFVSQALAMPDTLKNQMVIDAVSLVTDCELPVDTSILYYVANQPEASGEQGFLIGDFDWKLITPIGDDTNDLTHVVHFDGAQQFERFIRTDLQGDNDLQLIPPDTTNSDTSQRNPSPVIVPGVDIYRICKFDETFLPNTITLDEGINTTRIYHARYNTDAVKSLDWWSDGVKNNSYTVTYGRIDTGNEFFYGGDVGESGRSVYLETYLNSESGTDTPLLMELSKSDPNSKTWSVHAFLNGKEIGWLPGDNADTVGTPVDKLIVPWNFQQGLNHVALLINIPSPTSLFPTPYIGTLELMSSRNLYDYGIVKLATWDYVDFFFMKNNETASPTTFTVYNGEVISRRNPTENFRLVYLKSTESGPNAIRLRADLSRSINNMHVTPKLNSYRLRFSYGNQGSM